MQMKFKQKSRVSSVQTNGIGLGGLLNRAVVTIGASMFGLGSFSVQAALRVQNC